MKQGTTLTSADFKKVFEQLDSMYPEKYFSSAADFESDYAKSREQIAKDYEKIKYLEMWKKVKKEFPFVNKM